MITFLRGLNEAMKQAVHMVVDLMSHVYDLAYEWAGLLILLLFVWLVIAVVIVEISK